MPQYVNPNDLNQPVALLATIDPISQGAGTVSTPWVHSGAFRALLAIVQTGVLGASATVDAKLQQASDASGTGAADFPAQASKAITQIVKASGDNKQAIIVAPKWQGAGAGSKPYVRLSITVGTAASQISALLLGAQPDGNSGPVALPASAVEIVGGGLS